MNVVNTSILFTILLKNEDAVALSARWGSMGWGGALRDKTQRITL